MAIRFEAAPPFKRSEAFMKGYNTQQPKHFNPYSKGTQDRDDWDHGWLTRFYGETP